MTTQLPPGSPIDGKYTVTGVLHTRIGATVYEAHAQPDVPLAVTLYDGECFPSTLVLERCMRELRQLQRLEHPAIVPVLDLGRSGDGLYEVQPLFLGQSLRTCLHGGPLNIQQAARVIARVGEALLEGVQAGITHRNVGVDTVFFDGEQIRVVGFAVAEPRGGASFGPLLTMAPEQVEGKAVDQRTLIYNLACLMHWMLTGHPLFSGEPEAVMAAHGGQDPDGEVHPSLRRALAKDPRMRPMILKNFVAELAALGGERITVTPRAQPDPVASPPSRGWTLISQPSMAQPPVDEPSSAPALAPERASDPKTVPVSTGRGWTMFMEAADDGPAARPEDASPPPKAAEPTPSQSPSPRASQRGWTMFMEPARPVATDAGSGAAGELRPSQKGTMLMANPGALPSSPAREAPSEDASAPQPAPTAERRPQKRGWTMFMEAPLSQVQAGAVEPVAPATHVDDDAPVHRSSEPSTGEVEVPPRFPEHAAINLKKTLVTPPSEGSPFSAAAPRAPEPASPRSWAPPAPATDARGVSAAGGAARPAEELGPTLQLPSMGHAHRPSGSPYPSPRPSRAPLVVALVVGSAAVLGGAIWLALSAS